MVHGRLLEGDGSILDEVLIAVFRAPRSYTGEDSAEVHLHGSPLLVERALHRLYRAGFQAAEPGEFTRRAFLNGKLDLTQAEAIDELIRAQSEVGSRMAVNRLAGAVSGQIREIRSQIVRSLAALSVQLDYGEDEVDTQELDSRPLEVARDELERLLHTHRSARLYEYGARVVLAGATNAGKSSLFNRLVGSDRALVSREPGTTRDYLETHIQLEGVPVVLVDTAGLRAAEGDVEQAGMERSRSLIRAADLVVEIVDGTAPVPAMAGERRRLRVWNKVDLCRPPAAAGQQMVAASAVTGEGLTELRGEIRKALVGEADTAPDTATIASDRQAALLTEALHCIRRFTEEHRAGSPHDVLAFELQQAAVALGTITGETVSEDVLDAMFSSFCVGK
jgi:tRNA modification GTPase